MRLADLRGAVLLAAEGVQGVARIAEELHAAIARVAPPIGKTSGQPARGIAGFVYRTVRSTSGMVGRGLDAAMAGVQALLPAPAGVDAGQESPARRAVLSVVNGIVGDHLARTGNPLAIRMELIAASPPRPRLLLLVHGLCMSEQGWAREGYDHGRALAKSLDATAVYVRYNSGRHVSENGGELAAKLEQLVARWPVAVERIAILGHSMGGLVMRSAVHQAQQAGMAWRAHLRQMIFLGTPHHGAALERGGNWLHALLRLSPYLAPFARLAGVRSDGITDLRHGNVTEGDWRGDSFAHRDLRSIVPLPSDVACYSIAGAVGRGVVAQALGDGLVTVDSAFGRHVRATHDLHFPLSHTWVAPGVHHLQLLCSAAVHRKLRVWLRRRDAAVTMHG